jgi:hypothetical protein
MMNIPTKRFFNKPSFPLWKFSWPLGKPSINIGFLETLVERLVLILVSRFSSVI